MIPKYLRLSGFLSYGEGAEVDFTSFELACISGSNGAGKSSLLDAITWAMFGQARRRDDALINSHSKRAEVTFDFWYEGVLYRILRSKAEGKTGLLEFFAQTDDGSWRPLTEHSLRETEVKIQHTLRMDFETFTNASFFLQGKADQFAQQRPAERKRILGAILGLEVWDDYRERATERRKQLESQLNSLNMRIAEIDAELAEEQQRRERLDRLNEDLARLSELAKQQQSTLDGLRRLKSALDEQLKLVQALAGQVESAERRAAGRSEQMVRLQVERDAFRGQLEQESAIREAYAQWGEVRRQLEQRDAEAADFRQWEGQRATPWAAIEAERARLETELRGLLEQNRQAEELEKRLPEHSAALSEAAARVEQLTARMAQRPLQEAELQAAIEGQSEAQAENRRLKEEMTALKERIDQLKEVSGALCPLCGQPMSPDERARLVASLEQQGKDLGDRYRANLEAVRVAAELQTQLSEGLKQFGEVEAALRQQQRTLDQMEDRHRQAQEMLQVWVKDGLPRLNALKERLDTGAYAENERAELARIDAALAELGYDAAAHDQLRRQEQALRSSEEQLRQLETARGALGPLERQMEELASLAAAENAELETTRASHSAALERYQAEAASLPDLEKAEDELFRVKEQENMLRAQVGGAQQAVQVLDTLRVRRQERERECETIRSQVMRLKLLEKAFGKDGVPALLIEQALPEIEAQANDLLDRLTNGQMSVRFATQKDYKDKSRDDKKETLDILISDAAGTREYELFSGGEAFRVNFAIRLALSRVLAKRAGARLQTLVIDEGFGSQDADGRQRLIEAINLVRQDFAKVLVITHMEELKEAFPARIEVEKTLTGSQVRVVS